MPEFDDALLTLVGGLRNPHAHEPLVDEALWIAAQPGTKAQPKAQSQEKVCFKKRASVAQSITPGRA